jgi:hypothetical protein
MFAFCDVNLPNSFSCQFSILVNIFLYIFQSTLPYNYFHTHTHTNTRGRCKVIININYVKYPSSSLIVVLVFLVASFCYFWTFFSEKLRIFFVFFNVKCGLLQNFPTFAKKNLQKKIKNQTLLGPNSYINVKRG